MSGAAAPSPVVAARIYVGTFLVAFATLSLEIALTRLLSVTTWYHLAFFAISTAMLGMTAGATHVYVRDPDRAAGDVRARIAEACAAFGAVVPVTLAILVTVPVSMAGASLALAGLLAVTLACSLPFYYAGIAITLVLTRSPLPVARVYAADLVGAASGCLFVLAALEWVDVPSLLLLCGAVGAAAAWVFAPPAARAPARVGLGVTGGLVFVTVLAAATPLSLDPRVVKGRRAAPQEQVVDRWNSFSRVVVYRPIEARPWYWGPSPRAPSPSLRQYYIDIDGEAGTALGPFGAGLDASHLEYDVTNVAYHLRPRGGAAVIGIGGGRDVQSALHFGHERVTGIEVNPVFVELLEGRFADFAGLAGRPDVRLVVDDARSYLSRTDERFALIQMSMIDTWAATGAGAYAHTESGLYTLEAWSLILDRLAPGGVFTVSRWHDPANLGETARVVSLAAGALLEHGVDRPDRHIALVTTTGLSTLLLARDPFTPADLGRLAEVAEALEFEVTLLPGRPAADATLRALLAARSPEALLAAADRATLDVRPPTDDSPYFFNMVRLGDALGMGLALYDWNAFPGGVLRGNMVAIGVLLGLVTSLALVSLVTILLPLAIRPRASRGAFTWAGAAYFSAIGAAFMLVEIGLIQRLSVFLGHPVYALGILLFTVILSTGVGSLVSERLPLRRDPWRWVFPLLTGLTTAALAFGLPRVMVGMESAERLPRIVVSVAAIFPVGVLLGFFFPTGMALADAGAHGDTPWYWALNGAFGVLFSAVAVFVAMNAGITVNLLAGATLYALTALPLRRMAARPG